MFAPSVPPDGVSTDRPLPSRGSARVRSPRSAVRSADSDCSAALAPHLWPSLGATLRLVLFAPAGWTFTDRPGPLLSRCPRRVSLKERLSPPRFLGDPCVHALLSDPGGVSPSDRYNVETVAFRYLDYVGSADISIEALSHSLHAPCVRFAGGITPAPRHTRFRWMVSPFRLETCTRWAATRSFRFAISVRSLPLLPGFAWRNQTMIKAQQRFVAES
jgi:hypothetical protein